MLNKCMTLIRIQLRGIFMNSQYGGLKRKKNGKFMTMALTTLLIGCIFLLYCGFFTWTYINMGLSDIILPLMLTVASVFILFTTIFKANGFLLASKDDDLLMSMPIENAAIIISRFAALYLFELAISAVIMLPTIVVYEAMCGIDIIFLLQGLIGIFFIPMIPLAIATLIGVVITFAASHFRHNSLVAIVLGFAGLLLIVYYSMNMSSMDEGQFMQINTALFNMITKFYPPAWLFFKGLQGSAAAYIGYLAVSAVIFILVTGFISWRFKSLSTAFSSRHVQGNYKLTTLKAQSAFKALLGKEYRRYFSSPMYVLNTGIVYIFLILGGVAIFFIDSIEKIIHIPGASDMIGSYLPLIVALFAAIGSTTSSSLSLEGKNLWLPVSFPVRSKMVFDAKICVNLSLNVPATLFCSVMMVIRFRPQPFQMAALILVPVMFAVLACVGGMYLNIRFPNFKWTNETAVVKQGAASFISVFGGMILVFIPGGLLMAGVSAEIVYTAALILLIALCIGLYRLVCKTKLLKFMDD